MESKKFDVAVVGAGPAGYVAALRCAQNGMRVALIERAFLGGTCLNCGCIPAKAMLHATHAHKGEPISDLEARTQTVLQKLRNGVQTLLDKRGVVRFCGHARPMAGKKLFIATNTGDIEIDATHTVWATGALPVRLPCLPFDGKRIVSSTEALAFDRPPATLCVVGAGAIGLELGSLWARLGAKVTIVEALAQIAPGFDSDVAAMAERFLKRREGLSFETSARVVGFDDANLLAEKNGRALALPAEKILVAVGRTPDSGALESAGIALDEKKRVVVDARYETNVKGIYAIGDLIAGPMLAHKAEADAEALADILAGKPAPAASAIPAVIYTSPELALVGLTETAAKARGLAVKAAKFPFAANGRALASECPEGFVKLVGDAESGALLGAQILGESAGELIGIAAAHLAHGARVADLAHTILPHPSLSETLKEAASAWLGKPLHTL